jgi:SnoaL-like domain
MGDASASGISTIEDVVERMAIYDVVTRYCRACDRHDSELLRSCYHDDAIDDHGIHAGTIDEWVRFVAEATTPITWMQHAVENFHVLGIKGDLAATETYWNYRCIGTDGELGYQFGRYLDRFERRQGVWRIAHRVCVLGAASSNTGYDLDAYPRGSVDKTDPSYALVALVT